MTLAMVSAGLCCPVGVGLSAAAAAVHAGISQLRELPYKDNLGQPIIGAALLALPLEISYAERLTELLCTAVLDAMERASGDRIWEKVPLLVGLAQREQLGHQAVRLEQHLLAHVSMKLDVQFHPTLSKVSFTGHLAGVDLLIQASDLIQSRAVPECLVCAVDSHMRAPRLLSLERSRRLRRRGESDGVLPGEGAAAMIIARPRHAEGTLVTGIGFGQETATVLNEEPFVGRGLADATRAALAQARREMKDLDFRMCDVSGESYAFKEQVLLTSRLLRTPRPTVPLLHPAEAFGDVGAASGLVQLALVDEWFTQGMAPGGKGLCTLSCEYGRRGAMVVEQQNPRRAR